MSKESLGGYTRSMWKQMIEDKVIGDIQQDVLDFIKQDYPDFTGIVEAVVIDTYPKFQACWGLKSYQGNRFEEVSYHPEIFDYKKDAVDWIAKSKDPDSKLITYFILDVY